MDPNPRLLGDDLTQRTFDDFTLESRMGQNSLAIGADNPLGPDFRTLVMFNLFDYLKAFRPKLQDKNSSEAVRIAINEKGSGASKLYLTTNLTNCSSFKALIVFEETDNQPSSPNWNVIGTQIAELTYSSGVLTYKSYGSKFNCYLTGNKLQIDCIESDHGFYNVMWFEAYGNNASISAFTLSAIQTNQGTIVGKCIEFNGKLTEDSFGAVDGVNDLATLDDDLPAPIYLNKGSGGASGEFLAPTRSQVYGSVSKKRIIKIDLDAYATDNPQINLNSLALESITVSNWYGDLDIIVTSYQLPKTRCSITAPTLRAPRLVRLINDTTFIVDYKYTTQGGPVTESVASGQTLYDHQLSPFRKITLSSRNGGDYAKVLYKPMWTEADPSQIPPEASRYYQTGIYIFLPKLPIVVYNGAGVLVDNLYFGTINYSSIRAKALIVPFNSGYLHSDIEWSSTSSSGTELTLLTNSEMQNFVNGYKDLEDVSYRSGVANWNNSNTYIAWNFKFEYDTGTVEDLFPIK